MVEIPWPTSTSPGLRPQDGAGRLINVFVESRGGDEGAVWRRVPGAVVFTTIMPTEFTAAGTATVSFVGVAV